MRREDRRVQLLGVAHAIIRAEGTDALTLARVAAGAGVTKPIAYDHFGTRAGMLAALFRSFDSEQVGRMRQAMAVGGDSLEAATRIAAAGYLDCLIGPEYEDLSAALLAYEETKDFLRESRAAFVEAYREVFAPFVELEGADGRALLVGLVGAAESLAHEMQDEVIGREAAIAALAAILLATLTPRVTNRLDGPSLPAVGSQATAREGAPDGTT